jgi:hypothetical protein
MTNFISLSLFVTNMASGPVPAVKIGYYSATPYAIMASRDCKSWQLLVSTTNAGPHRGTIITSQIDRQLFWLNTNVYVGSIPNLR